MRILSAVLISTSLLSAPAVMAAKVKLLPASDMVNDAELRCVGRLALIAHRLGKDARTAKGTPLADLGKRLNDYGPEVGNRALGRYKTDAKAVFAAFGAHGKAWEAEFDRAPDAALAIAERECLPALVIAETARTPMRLSQCAAWIMGDSSEQAVAGIVTNPQPVGESEVMERAILPGVLTLMSSFRYRLGALAELKAEGIVGPAANKILAADAASVRKERELAQKGKRFAVRQDQYCAQQVEKYKPAKPATSAPVKPSP